MHKVQSELGTTGECSPNIDLVLEITQKLNDNFKHEHGTITEYDCVLCLCNFYVGKRIDGKKEISASLFQMGCASDLVRMISNFLASQPEMIAVMMASCAEAQMKILDHNKKTNEN